MDNTSDNSTVNYHEYILSDEWRLRVQEAKRRAAYRCQVCNQHEDEVILDGHHRTYERLGKEWPEDITILCRDCHELFERHKRLAKFGLSEVLSQHHLQSLSELVNIRRSSSEQVVCSGVKKLDALLGGFNPGDLIIIAGQPGNGKTSLLVNIASAAVKSKIQTAIFSLQTSAEKFAKRLMSVLSGIETHRLQNGPLDKKEIERIKKVEEDLKSNSNLFIDKTPTLTLSQLRHATVDLYMTRQIKLVLVDGVELISKQKAQDLRCVIHSLKNLARELHLQVIATCPTTYTQSLPSLLDTHYSIRQLADVIILIYRDELYNPKTDKAQMAELTVAKHRHGPTRILDLAFSKETGQLSAPVHLKNISRPVRRKIDYSSIQF